MTTTMTATATAVRTLQIDRAHSDVAFQVRHLLSRVRGRFSEFDGTIKVDESDMSLSSVAFTIQAASIDTNQADRDTHLRSADFFSAEAFPTLTFVSTKVTPRGTALLDVTGDLTIRGVTKSITLPVTFLGAARDPWGVEKLAFETEVVLNRKDFGLTWNAVLETGGFVVGDDVKVSLSLQAKEQ